MFDTLTRESPPPAVLDDAAVQQTTRAWTAAQAALDKVEPRYRRCKVLMNPGPSRSLDDIGATPEDQDHAFIDFPTLVREYGAAVEAEHKTRQAHEAARAQAYAARKRWHTDRVREKEAELVDLVSGPLYQLVRDIHDALQDAGREEIPIQPDATLFPDIPLRIGGSTQAGLEWIVGELRRLLARP